MSKDSIITITDEDVALAAERLGWTVREVRTRHISLAELTRLLGTAAVTTYQWHARSKRGQMAKPMPKPDPKVSKHDKPLWHFLNSMLPWLIDTDRWPPEKVARPERRGPRDKADQMDRPPPAVFLPPA